MRSAVVQVNDWGEGKRKDTNQKSSLICASLLLAADRGLENHVENGARECCIARRASETCMEKWAWDERNAALKCRGFVQVPVGDREEVRVVGRCGKRRGWIAEAWVFRG